MSELDEWITTEKGAGITGYCAGYVRMLAREGRITAQRAGRDWLVNRDSLLEYKRKMDRLGTDKHNPWREDLDDRGRKR